jgi:hypothetical protein
MKRGITCNFGAGFSTGSLRRLKSKRGIMTPFGGLGGGSGSKTCLGGKGSRGGGVAFLQRGGIMGDGGLFTGGGCKGGTGYVGVRHVGLTLTVRLEDISGSAISGVKMARLITDGLRRCRMARVVNGYACSLSSMEGATSISGALP